MYKKTLPHQQSLFTRLDSRSLAKLNKSQDKLFYKLITSNIDESLFSVLYDQSQGRPNSSVRALVASIIYINHKGWTHKDFFDSLDFNLLTRAAISNLDIKGKIFSPATFYNFENRLLKYWKDSGVNLLETKRGVNYQGQVVTISESCNPKNDVNLIIDMDVSPNNIDDSKIFSKRLFRMKNRYSDINEVHVDGAYPSDKNDKITSFLGISLIPTGVKGRKATIPIEINLTKVGDYKVKCPTQEVVATQGRKRFKALFNYDKCNDCPFNKIL